MTANIESSSASSTSSVRATIADKIESLIDTCKSVKTALGDFVDLTGIVGYLSKAETAFNEFTNSHFVTNNYQAFLSTAIHVSKLVKLIAKSISSGAGAAAGHITDSLQIFSIINIKSTVDELKAIPAAFKAAQKTAEKSKVILGAMAAVGKVFTLADSAIKGISSFTNTIQVGSHLAKLAPSLAAVGLILSTAATALKIWDLKETYQFGNKMKKQCCQQLIITLENELKAKINESSVKDKDKLLAKLDHAIKISHKTNEKAVYKSLQKELSKNPIEITTLAPLLEKVNVTSGPLLALKNNVEAVNLLANPKFVQECQENTAKFLDVALDDLKNLGKSEEKVNFKTLKKELKEAVATIDHELLADIDRSSKLAYMDVLADYNVKKVGKAYQLKGADLQGTAKKVAEQSRKLIAEGDLSKADEILSSHHRELKRRVTFKKTTDFMALGLNGVGMASSAIGIGVAFGALATPAAPAAIILGVAASVLGLGLAYAKHKKNIRSEENLGITESRYQKKWQDKLAAIKGRDNDPFINNLNPDQKKLLEGMTEKINNGEFDEISYYRFALPVVDPKATPDEQKVQKAALKTANELNNIIISMNKWAGKKPYVQERFLGRHLSHQLPKIDPTHVPPEGKEVFLLVQQKIQNKNYDAEGLKLLTLNPAWTPEQKAAVANINNLILSIYRAHQTRLNVSISNLTKRCEIMPILFKNEFPGNDLEELISGRKQCTSPKMQERVNVIRSDRSKLAALQDKLSKLAVT